MEMLNILENFDLRKSGRLSPQTLHVMIEAMRRAYCDRARYLGDSDFVKIPPQLITKDYGRALAHTPVGAEAPVGAAPRPGVGRQAGPVDPIGSAAHGCGGRTTAPSSLVSPLEQSLPSPQSATSHRVPLLTCAGIGPILTETAVTGIIVARD